MANVQVLVLDDDDRLREVLVDALEEAGYTAVGVGSAAEALERFAEIDPALILLDMMMPGMDGFEFLSRLRAEPLCSNVPVLIGSGLGGTLSRAVDAQSAATLGIVGVLSKPVPLPTLLAHVRRVLG